MSASNHQTSGAGNGVAAGRGHGQADAAPAPAPVSPAERVELLRRVLGEPACRQLGIYPIPAGFTLSVVMPVYNEKEWIREILRRVQAVPIPKEIIVVDDCSTDGTRDILRELDGQGGVRVFLQPVNQGKG